MKTAKAIKKRDQILLSAANVVAEKGYSHTTLSDIAEGAGTFAGSLYYYFPSKEVIVEEVLNTGTNVISSEVMARVIALGDDIPAIDKIRIGLRTHFKLMLKLNPFVVAYWKIIDQVPEEIRQRHLALPKAYGHFWERLFSEAQAGGQLRADLDANAVSLLIIGSTVYALRWYRPGQKYTPDDIVDTLLALNFDGLLPKRKATDKIEKASKPKRIVGKAQESSEKAVTVDPQPVQAQQLVAVKSRTVRKRSARVVRKAARATA